MEDEQREPSPPAEAAPTHAAPTQDEEDEAPESILPGTPPPASRKRRTSSDDTSGSDSEPSEPSEPQEQEPSKQKKRRNIKDVLDDEQLGEEAKAAQAREEERLRRLQEHQAQQEEAVRAARLQEGFRRQIQERQEAALRRLDPDCIDLSSDEDEEGEGVGRKENNSEEDDDIKVVSASDDSDSDGETSSAPSGPSSTNSGLHINDALNTKDSLGNVLVNVARPPEDEEVQLAPQLARVFKPHQIGGIRFLYDNIIESTSAMRRGRTQGFGCILAHSMGLGKTIQVVAFCDVFLRHTIGKHVLCIVPINTLQNWICEFDHWLPDRPDGSSLSRTGEVRPRDFGIYVLNDTLKNLEQRSQVILTWRRKGGVLLMGYELYRQMANKKQRKKKKPKGPELVDFEEEDKAKDMLDSIYECLVDPGPDLVICDEGHRIKNQHASISKCLKAIKTKRRVVLTGYPLQNNLVEYWCMVDFVRPNFLGSKTDFANQFERPIQNGQCVDSTPKDKQLMRFRAHVLHTKLKGFVQRRGHDVLRCSLPSKSEHVLLLRMTPFQRRLYRTFIADLQESGPSGGGAAAQAMAGTSCNPLKAFAVCCKIWNHPDVLHDFVSKRHELSDLVDLDFLDDAAAAAASARAAKAKKAKKKTELMQDPRKEEINYDWAIPLLTGYRPGILENSTKFVAFFALLEETLKAGDRMLVFTQSLMTLNLLERFLQERKVTGTSETWRNGLSYFRLDGSTSASDRERLVTAFNGSERVKLFMVSTKAGSLGINLVGANRVVVMDASWNPCHDSQAVCRVYRYGQRKRSHIYRLVVDNSIEKKIYDRQINKQGMSDRVVDESNPDLHFSSKDIHTLISGSERDPPADLNLAASAENFKEDAVLRRVIRKCGNIITREPFAHESLLVDRKERKLSKAEKRLAERHFEKEQRAQISYTRSSYAAFYPKEGMEATNLNVPGSNGLTRQRYGDATTDSSSAGPSSSSNSPPFSAYDNPRLPIGDVPLPKSPTRPVASVRPMPNPGQPGYVGGTHRIHSDVGSLSEPRRFPLEALARQGVDMKEIVVPRDMSIPNNSSDQPPISLKAGQRAMFIQTPKGIYLRMGEKIIKIKMPEGGFGAAPMGAAAPTSEGSSTSSEVVSVSDGE